MSLRNGMGAPAPIAAVIATAVALMEPRGAPEGDPVVAPPDRRTIDPTETWGWIE